MATQTARRLPARRGESFLVLPENQAAWTAVKDLAEKRTPARLVYLYGPSGSGKTLLAKHFLRCVQADGSRDAAPKTLTAAQLDAEFVAAVAENTVHEFRDEFSAISDLVVEDVQALSSRTKAQQLLTHVLDEILAGQGRVLITSNRMPGALEGFLPRLVNRFHGGNCVPLRSLEEPSRRKLLEHLAQTMQIPVPPESIALLAARCAVSGRELAGVLTRIEAAARLRNGDLSPDSIQQRLDDATRPPVTIAEVAKQVARHCNLTRTALRDRGRAQNVSLARQLAMYLSRKLTGASHRAIGDYFGRRDHSTVLHACRRIAELLPADTRLRHLSATIEQGLHDG